MPAQIPASLPRKSSRPDHSGSLLGGVGVLANAAAVAALLISNSQLIGLTAGLVAIISGGYWLAKRWGKPVDWRTSIACVAVAGGSVLLALVLQARGTITVIDTANNGQGNSHQTDNSGKSDGKPLPPASPHNVVLEKVFELKDAEGLELDDEKGTIKRQLTMAQAPVDLFMSDWPLVTASTDKFYPYMPPANPTGNADKDEYASCDSLIKTSQLGISSLGKSQFLSGQQYCFLTTQKRVALITPGELIDDGYERKNDSSSFTLKLWN